MFRSKLINICQHYHGQVHLLFGLLAYLICIVFFNISPGFSSLFIAVIASFLPDIDHLFFYYFYGRNTHYAQTVRSYIQKFQIRKYLDYVQSHHKSNYFILSHNLLTPLGFVLLFIYFIYQNSPDAAVFSLSFAMHFIFDMAEDLLALGRLNPNWYLKFQRNI
jgi:hypothetical protein